MSDRPCNHLQGQCPDCPEPGPTREELLEAAKVALARTKGWMLLAINDGKTSGVSCAKVAFDDAHQLCLDGGETARAYYPEEYADATEALAALVVPWLAREIAQRDAREAEARMKVAREGRAMLEACASDLWLNAPDPDRPQYAAFNRLRLSGLLEREQPCAGTWRLTDAGRAALKQVQDEEASPDGNRPAA